MIVLFCGKFNSLFLVRYALCWLLYMLIILQKSDSFTYGFQTYHLLISLCFAYTWYVVGVSLQFSHSSTIVFAAYPNDNTRLDVVVANEQRWYLKASNAAERQAWLISLGTSKANAGKEQSPKGRVGNNLKIILLIVSVSHRICR